MGEVRLIVLMVDPAVTGAADLRALLEREGVKVAVCSEVAEAVRFAAGPGTSAVIAPLGSEGIDALGLIDALKAGGERPWVPLLGLDQKGDPALRLSALQLGADDVVSRECGPDELLARVRRLLALKEHIDALVRRSENLHQLSITDGLTGAFNHRFFHERLKEEFRRAQRYDDPLALLVLDVDHFKAVNDAHGHPVGDEVLREVAEAIRKAVRDTDLLARCGGEEFAVLLPRTPLAGALTVAERVWRAVGALRVGPQAQERITASVGVSGFPSRSVLTSEQLVGTADEALYRAKREGRNKICLSRQVSFFSNPPA
jgi:two-component system, cell cycle response regulator